MASETIPIEAGTTAVSKKHLSMVVFGPHHSGKSTLSGQLLYNLGHFERDELEHYELECAQQDTPMQKYAWLVDRSDVERKKQLTQDFGVYEMETSQHSMTLVNAPGHKTYQKNFLSALSIADIGLLVVPADDSYEGGMIDGGVIKDHCILAYAYGLTHVVVAVNKLDEKEFSKSRYTDIEEEVCAYLVRKVGFDPDRVKCVPTSGFHGDNVCEKMTRLPWYDGPTLLDVLNTIPAPNRSLTKHLRIGIVNVFTIGGAGTVAVGRVDSGVLKPGMPLSFAPTSIKGPVESLEVHHKQAEYCGPGAIVGMRIRNVFRHEIYRGCVAGDTGADPPRPVTRFTAKMVLLNAPGTREIAIGYTPIVSCHASHVACRIVDIKSIVDRKSGEVLDDSPEGIAEGQSAILEFEPIKPVCVESFSRHPALGRFALRDANKTIGCGIVLSVKHPDEDATPAAGEGSS